MAVFKLLFLYSVFVILLIEVAKAVACPTIISRSSWGARPPKSTVNIAHPILRVFIHHTETASCSTQTSCSAAVRNIQNYHMNTKGWDDIGYNFLVGEDGNVYEGRGWNHVGAQAKGHNLVSIGIAVIGNYQRKVPNSKALNAVTQLIACGVSQSKLSAAYKLHGHRDGVCTECPGQVLYNLVKTWPHYGGQLPGHC